MFRVSQDGETRGRLAYWHAVNGAEVHFERGVYSVQTRRPQRRTDEVRLRVNVQELALDDGEFGGEYSELPERVERQEQVTHGAGWHAGIAVLNPTHFSALLSDLEIDVDMWLTDAQGREVGASRNASNVDDRIDVLLWPGLYELAIEAVDQGSSPFRLGIVSEVVAANADTLTKDVVGEGGNSFEVLTVADVERVTVGLTELSTDVDVRIFDAERNEIGSSLRADVADEEIVALLWPGQYAVEVTGPAGADFRLDVERSTPDLRSVPVDHSGSIREGEEQYVGFRIEEHKTVRASMTGLSADVDLKLVGESGELASSVNAEVSDEWLEEELAPGDYFVGVVAFDGDSDFSLTVVEAEVAQPPGRNSPSP